MSDNSVMTTIRVEVAFGLSHHQEVIELWVGNGTTAQEAIEKSGIQGKFPELDVTQHCLGIFARSLNGVDLPLPENYILQENDRVEIYRNLIIDPKQARLERAQKNQLKKRGK